MANMCFKKFKIKCDSFDVLELFKDESYVFCLDSSQYDYHRGRYSFIGFNPFAVEKLKGKDSLEEIKKKYLPFKEQEKSIISPFCSGIVGFLSYDYGLYDENIQLSSREGSDFFDTVFGFYDCVITIDHNLDEVIVVSTGVGEKSSHLQSVRAQNQLDYVVKKLEALFNEVPKTNFLFNRKLIQDTLKCSSNFSKERYLKTVEKALEYISQGDIYQVNLSQQFMIDLKVQDLDVFLLYKILRQCSPTPFGGYIDGGDFQVLSSSPERFLQLQGRCVQTRPMKGTRPRGINAEHDEQLRNELIVSEKDKAELLMITDLERNDLGKVCEFGSVFVKESRIIEEYKTVFQATTTIEGMLKKELDGFDLLKSCFPGGSITGCPKIRAMEIIEELEPTRRSIYTGCLGYIGFDGTMDFNILIRSLLKYQDKVYFQVGGAIVADSTPEGEYQETLVKAKAMIDALNYTLESQEIRVG